jgi:hypothetical protein
MSLRPLLVGVLSVLLGAGGAVAAHQDPRRPGESRALPAPVHLVGVTSYDGRDDCGGYSYSHGCRHGSGDRDGRDDNRRAGISPGPFDRSPVDIHDNNVTVCFPFSTCGKKDDGTPTPAPPPKKTADPICVLRSLPWHCDTRL